MMQTNRNRRTERKGQSNGRHQMNGCGKRQRRGTEPVRSAHKWVDSPRYTYSPLSCRSPQRKSVIQAHETQGRLVYYCPVWPVHVTEQICTQNCKIDVTDFLYRLWCIYQISINIIVPLAKYFTQWLHSIFQSFLCWQTCYFHRSSIFAKLCWKNNFNYLPPIKAFYEQ